MKSHKYHANISVLEERRHERAPLRYSALLGSTGNAFLSAARQRPGLVADFVRGAISMAVTALLLSSIMQLCVLRALVNRNIRLHIGAEALHVSQSKTQATCTLSTK